MPESCDDISSLDPEYFTGRSKEPGRKFADAPGDVYHHIGFVAIRNYFLGKKSSSGLYTAIKDSLSLNEKLKCQYALLHLAGQRGYVNKGKGHIKGRNRGDLKEFYYIGQELPDDHKAKDNYPKNIRPIEVSNFKRASLQVYDELECTGPKILRAIDHPKQWEDIAAGEFFAPRLAEIGLKT